MNSNHYNKTREIAIVKIVSNCRVCMRIFVICLELNSGTSRRNYRHYIENYLKSIL